MRYLVILFLLFTLQSGYAADRPNVIIIFVDDLGYGDLSCYGHPTIRTPNLDRMAEEGMRFTQFYAAASVCTPSRAGLLTGRYPVRTGMVKGKIPGRVLFPGDQTGLPLNEVTIAEVVKEKGYATSMVGKWHLGHLPQYLPVQQGFDHYYGIPYSNDMDHVGPRDGKPAYWNVPIIKDTIVVERPAEQTTLTQRYTEKALEFIRDKKNEPFFLYLAHTMPHVPLFASEKFEGTSERGLYGDVVEEIDWSVGQILELLKEQQLDKNTLVVFTSDNGPWLAQDENGGSAGLLKDGKGTTWEGGMRVPMIAWWPESIAAGIINTNLATTLDLLPTVAELTEAGVPDNIDGVSLMDLLKGADTGPRDFFAYYRNDELYAARFGPWKAHFITQTEYPAGPKAVHDPPLLYHLENDPSEQFNVASDHPDVLVQIESLVEAHLASIEVENRPSVEGEFLINTARVTGGRLRVQDMGNFQGTWSGDQQLWWVEAKPGDQLSFQVEVEKSGNYQLFGFFTRAGDYGIVRLSVNGKQVGELMDGYSDHIESSGSVPFGTVGLIKGDNTITLEIVGKDYRSAGYSQGYLVGFDGLLLK